LSGNRSFTCKHCGTPFNGTIAQARPGSKKLEALATDGMPPPSVQINPPAIVRIEAPEGFKAAPTIFTGRNGRINLDPANHFKGLIDRENQLDVIFRSLKTADDTNFEVTPHVLISGPTGSGKSTLLRGLKSMIGEANYLDISAPNSTQAGIIGELLERDHSAIKVVFINELDKTKGKGDNYKWVLSAMDEERQIKVCNAHLNTIIPLHAIFIADCNSVDKVDQMQVNAVGNRFTTRVHCPRLSNDSLWRAVKKYTDLLPDANDGWIQPAIDYVTQEEGTDNVRRIITLACDGRDGWLDGSFANTLRSIRKG
jgi:energy-coupling factor transporter ATP-binding protein EcfA2